jgi:predicted RNA-binding protein with PUA-like domain
LKIAKIGGFARDSCPGLIKNGRMQYWMVKQEPETYSWADFVADGKTSWTGVRNYQARNNLRSMKVGDLVFYYHSVSGKEIVGLARVTRSAYPDPTATEGDWSCVDLEPHQPLPNPVSLERIKGDAALKEMPLVKNSRLSVLPLTKAHFERILKLAQVKA